MIRKFSIVVLTHLLLVQPSLWAAKDPAVKNAEKIASMKSFVTLIIKEWEKQTGKFPQTHLDEEEYLLHIDGFQLNIQSLFESYGETTSKQGYVKDFIKSLIENEGKKLTFEEIKKSIFPLVRSTKWFETQDMYMNESKTDLNNHVKPLLLPRKEINSYLSVGLLISLPSTEDSNPLQYVTSQDLQEWNKTLEELFPLAKENLSLSKTIFKEIAPGVWAAGDRWDSDANIMFLPHLFKELSIKGKLIAIHPHKGWVIVTGSEDIEGLKETFNLCDQLSESEKALSGHIFILKNDTWDLFMPDETHPLYREIYLRNLKADEADFYYLRDCIQKKLHQYGEKDVHIAGFSINENELESLAALLDKKQNIVPVANKILIDVFSEDTPDEIFKTCVIPLRKLFEVCAHRISQLLYSKDYFVFDGFPSKDELIKLGVDVKHMRKH